MKKVSRLAPLLLTSTTLLGGCASTTVAIASLCGSDKQTASWESITVLKADKITQPTAKQILQNNVAHEAVCGKKQSVANYP